MERVLDRPSNGRALKTWAVRAGQLALTALVTWFIVSRVGLGIEELRGIESGIWRPRPLPFLASMLVLAFGYFMSAAIWGRMVEDLGGPRLPARSSVPMFMVANLGRYLPGKVWQIAGLAALARRRGVPVSVATGAAVMGQGVALVAASAIGTLALFASPDPYPFWAAITAGVIVGGLALAAIPAVYGRVLGAWFRLARAERPEALGPAMGAGWLGFYMVNWAVYSAAFVLLASSFGAEGPVLALGSAFAAAYVLGYVMIFAPAGLGPREGFLIVFLTPHVGAGSAALIAIAARLWTTVVEVVPAAVFWFAGGVRGASHHEG